MGGGEACSVLPAPVDVVVPIGLPRELRLALPEHARRDLRLMVSVECLVLGVECLLFRV